MLIDSARISIIRAGALAEPPLYGANFPQSRGTVSFDIYPIVRTDINQSEFLPVFDDFSGLRNHMFMRHYDSINTSTGLTYCGTDPADTTKVCMQLALQMAGEAYISAKSFQMNAEQWQTVRISWNSILHTVLLQISANTPISLYWRRDANNLPVDWKPDKQNFVFRGRDRLDNIRVYDNDDPAIGTLLADFPMKDAVGSKVSDVSGMNLPAEIRGGVSWGTRSATVPDSVIKMDGTTGDFRTVSDSVIYYAWTDFYKDARSVATQINAGTLPLDVATAHPNAILNVSRKLGLSYLVTGEKLFLTAALKYADQLISVVPRSTGRHDYTQAGRIEAMGILYDWFFNKVTTMTDAGTGLTYGEALSAAIKKTLIPLEQFICGHGKTLTANWNCSSLPASPDAIGSHSHQNNTEITVALLAIIDEHSELEPLLKVEYDNFINLFNPAREWISIDGGHHMGWAYGGAYTFLDSIHLWNKATTDVNMNAAWQGKLINRYIYGLRGDMRFPASGDAFGYTPWKEQAVDFALWGSREFGNTYAQNFYNRIILPGKTGSRFYELLDWQAALPETPIENLPYSRFFRNSGQVLMRNSWDYSNATLLEFKSTSFQSINHHHLDQNAFTLFYKSPLLVDSGYYDKYGSEHWHNYYTRTIAHNTLTILDPAESFVRKWNFSFFCCSNDGGQQFPSKNYPDLADIQPGGSNHLDGITAYEYTPEYTYTRGNASKAYSATKLDQNNGFIRQLVFLRNPGFWPLPVSVIFDKIKTVSGKGSLKKRFLLHTVNEPEPLGGQLTSPGHYLMNGNTVTIRNGAGMVFSQTLLPVNPVITKIGGQDASGDYRFLVPVNDGAGGLVDRNFPPNPDPGTNNVDMGAWRIEIGSPLPSQQEYFLNVLSVADNTPGSQPPVVNNLSSSSAAVAELANNQVIVFNKLDDPAATLQWDMPVLNLATLIVGIKSSVGYAITAVNNTPPASGYHIVVCQHQGGLLNSSTAGTINIPTGPALSPDLDGDGIGDSCDTDIDGDGLSNTKETMLGTNPLISDTDGDLLSDGQEVNTYGTNPLNSDTDTDGLSDGYEVNTSKTSPTNPDTDGDGLPDGIDPYPLISSDPGTDNGIPFLPPFGIAILALLLAAIGGRKTFTAKRPG